MKERTIRLIADYLAHKPLGRIVSVLAVADDDYIVSIEDRRDGREHIMSDPRRPRHLIEGVQAV